MAQARGDEQRRRPRCAQPRRTAAGRRCGRPPCRPRALCPPGVRSRRVWRRSARLSRASRAAAAARTRPTAAGTVCRTITQSPTSLYRAGATARSEDPPRRGRRRQGFGGGIPARRDLARRDRRGVGRREARGGAARPLVERGAGCNRVLCPPGASGGSWLASASSSATPSSFDAPWPHRAAGR